VRLRRLLRRELNESAGAYFRKRRLETARALLAAGGLNVKQVAAQVGYRSDTAFSRAYRRQFGHAPTSPPQI
jgi:transcriptional regulator GlxA family with amidase domain